MFTCPFCGKAWGAGDQCQECGVPRGADPNQSLTEQPLGPVSEIFMLNPVNRGVVMGYSRWAGGKIEQQEAAVQVPVLAAIGMGFGMAFLFIFLCAATIAKAAWLMRLFGVLIFIGIAVLLWIKVQQVYRNSLLNRRFANAEGTLLTGEIIASRIRHIGSQHNRSTRVGIEYRFRAPDGQTLTGDGISRFPPPEGNLLPPPGTRVAVLYLDERHYKTL